MTKRSNQQIWVVMSIVLMAVISPSSAKVIYVDANAPGPTHDGSSWANAYKHLQDALADANSAAKPVEIKVAQGIYKPDEDSAHPYGTGDRTATFFLKNDVAIYGGFRGNIYPPPPPMSLNNAQGATVWEATTPLGFSVSKNASLDESDPNARDIQLYETFLSGDLDGNDVDVNDPCDLLNEPTRAENSYHIVFSQATDASAILDGFTITGGNANGTGGYPFFENGGGGLYNGIHMPGSPTLINCTFIENSTWYKGGAILNSGYFDEASPTLTNCTFSRNWAENGGGICNNGWYGKCSPKLTNCVFSRNSSNGFGGGIDNIGSWCNIKLTNCTFSNNSAGFGGAISTQEPNLTLTNCILWGDESDEIHGDAIVQYSCIQGGWPGQGNIDADPCFVRQGHWEPVISPLPGQASNPNPSDGTTNVSVIADLSWTAGSGATSHDVYFGTTSVPQFIGNQTSTTFDPGTMVFVTQYFWQIDEINIEGKTTGQIWSFTTQEQSPPPPPPNTILQQPPILPETQISNAGQYIWVDGDYHLRPDSPCINAGDPNYVAAPKEVDLDGKERVFGDRIDMGAYEYHVPTIYVDSNAPGPTHDGSSWANAYKFLQDALADAGSAAEPVEIRVAQGIYKPDQTSANPHGSGDRTATFLLINAVTLQGGYAGYGQPDPDARDIELYETILSGDLNGNDIDVNNPADLLDEPTRADNSYHVVTGSGTDANAVLDGFTITGGNANSSFPENCGGGLYNYTGSPTVTNCTFEYNTALAGGGTYNYLNSNPTLTNCTFRENFSDSGGGVCNSTSSNPTVINCQFKLNSAIGEGGGMSNYKSSPQLSNCTFILNSAYYGGGMDNFKSSPTLIYCTLSENSANRGGGIYNKDCSNPKIVNCIFTGNFAGFGGGGMFNVSYSKANLTNCTFANNSAVNYGGAIYWEYIPLPPPFVECNTRWLIITNCILRGNSDSSGSGESAQICSVLLPTISYNCIQGWTGALGGTGNIDANPCFADPCSGDYHLKSQEGRWDPNSQTWVRDDVTSPCIDAGNPGCPVVDEPAPNGNRKNMGAYGGTAEASKSPAYWRSIADMTNDWIVDSNDLKVFVGYWLQTGECIPGDLDRSRSVDSNDFALFAGQWRQKGPGPGITYKVDECIPIESPLSAAGESEPTRFTVTVEGQYILFEDLITANCCADEIELLMTVEARLITIYEIEHTPMPPCPCICDYPTTATLGPFDPGTYTFEVYQGEGFIGTTTVTIGPAS